MSKYKQLILGFIIIFLLFISSFYIKELLVENLFRLFNYYCFNTCELAIGEMIFFFLLFLFFLFFHNKLPHFINIFRIPNQRDYNYLLIIQILIIFLGGTLFYLAQEKIRVIMSGFFIILWFMVLLGISINRYFLDRYSKKFIFSKVYYYIWYFLLFFEGILWVIFSLAMFVSFFFSGGG